MEVITGQIYRHFKGNLYRVVTLAEHSETGETLVIYQALYGENRVYARPLAMFTEPVDRAKYPEADQEYRFMLWDGLGTAPGTQASGDSTPVREGTGSSGKNTPVPDGAGSPDEDARREAGDDGEDALTEKLNAFLDAKEFEDKLLCLVGMKNIVTDGMIDTMAFSLDLELREGSTAERYEELLQCVKLREKYENSRLRT